MRTGGAGIRTNDHKVCNTSTYGTCLPVQQAQQLNLLLKLQLIATYVYVTDGTILSCSSSFILIG